METFKLQTHIGVDGLLKVEVPTTLNRQEVEVIVILHPMGFSTTEESWPAFVDRMYGALADDPIERPPQLPLEERDPIE